MALKEKKKEKTQEASGRPTKFTPERCALIVDNIRNRIPYEYAAEANGITEKTLYNWIGIAKQHQEEGIDSEYTQFLQDIKKAEMSRMRDHLDVIAARPERWQADAWILERRWPKHFGSNSQLQELSNRLERLGLGEVKNDQSEEA